MTVNLCAIQLSSTPNVADNLAVIEQQLATLLPEQTHVVVLPECCLFFGGQDKAQFDIAQDDFSQQTMTSGLAKLAQRYQVYLVAGSIPAVSKLTDEKFANRSIVFAPSGQKIGHYDKIHLFDVQVNDSEKQYCESATTLKGTAVSTVSLPFATLGLSICYDLRFPELYRTLRNLGTDIITVPAAFTRVTGQAHWEALLRARAIENQVYIIAAGQEGVHPNGRETWGHSMIISPWGEILAQLPTGIGMISASYDHHLLADVRQNIPVAHHNQFKTELNTYE